MNQRPLELLRVIYGELHQSDEANFSDDREDFAFHIVECIDDFEDLLSIFQKTVTAESATRELVGFLYHVVPHLNAATRILLGGVPDTFAVKSNAMRENNKD